MAEKQWYFLDPDHNKKTPTSPHCARCKRKMKGSAGLTFICVELHPVYPWVRTSMFGRDLIGEDCWEKILKDGPVNGKI